MHLLTKCNWIVLAGAFAAHVGCAQAPLTVSPVARLLEAHNGRQQHERLGRVVEGSLNEGSTQSVTLQFGARCTTLAAFGSDGMRELALAVTDAHGAAVAGATARDQQPTMQFCPPQMGAYNVQVSATRGSGAFALGAWLQDPDDAPTLRHVASDGTCRAPIELELGAVVHGSTAEGRSMHTSSCSGDEYGVRANEVVYHLRVRRRTAVTLSVAAEWKSVLSVRTQCGDVESEHGCSAPGASVDSMWAIAGQSVSVQPSQPSTTEGNRPRISLIAEPGNYFVIIDGREGEAGDFVLSTRTDAVPTETERCQSAPLLVPGVAVTSTTVGEFDFFHSSCGLHGRGPDRTYRLELAERSRVQVELSGTTQPAVLHIHNRCSRSDDEVACESNNLDPSVDFRINTVLDPGVHYVVVDGAANGNASSFTLQADVLPVAGGTMTGDRCADAIALVSGVEADGNTFAAHDDVTLACGAAHNGLDQVFRLDLPERSVVRVSADGDFASSVALQLTRSCDGPLERSLCRDHAVGVESALVRVLPAGTHYVVVESARPGEFGKFTLTADVSSAAGVEGACSAARSLPLNRSITGSNRGRGVFEGSCADADNSPETVLRLAVEQAGEVDLHLERVGGAPASTTTYTPAIYVRRDCINTNSEIECRDSGDSADSVDLTFSAEPGVYYVFVDGAASGGPVRWRLRAEMRAE